MISSLGMRSALRTLYQNIQAATHMRTGYKQSGRQHSVACTASVCVAYTEAESRREC